MYPGYLSFTEENREWEESVFWFQDGMHHPEVLSPFDSVISECWRLGLGQYNSRIFVVPPAYGIDHRILNGYLYITPVPVEDGKRIGERAVLFEERVSLYYRNWDALFDTWKDKVRQLIADLEAISPPMLPRVEDIEVVREHRGRSSAFDLLQAYDETIENLFLAWQYHFEMLNIGYAAYLAFFQFCKSAFPGIGDDVIAQMTAGTDLLFFRPDDELRRLARLAVDLGIEERILRDQPVEEIITSLERDDATRAWVDEWQAAKDPWFNFSNGNGFYHHHRSWIDTPSVPWAALRRHVAAARAGDAVERPTAEILRRREEIASGYRDLLASDEDRSTFDGHLGLARTVAGYIEDHNFFVEHWHHTIFWNKIREFGRVLVSSGFLHGIEDVFLLNRWEVAQALYEMCAAWASGAPSRGPMYWRGEVSARRSILKALAGWTAPPALGPAPAEVTEPFTLMLWGITNERLQGWLGPPSEGPRIVGVPASPGVVEGPARVITTAGQLSDVREGEILVAPITSPSWGLVFGLIVGAVTDIGGVMSHAAIVSREYGLPAVVGAGGATRTIRTGDLLRVDGGSGEVVILSRSHAASAP